VAKTADVIVVGAGVVGCSVAYHLALKGVKGVTVLDRGTVGCEASTAAAGMLAPQCEAPGPGPFLDFCLAARRYYEQLAPELKELTQTDIEYLDCGIIYLLDDARDEAAEGRIGVPLHGGQHQAGPHPDPTDGETIQEAHSRRYYRRVSPARQMRRSASRRGEVLLDTLPVLQ